jgi:Raf kinase inhibitor-like YbhB/YbcL family protein
MKSAYLVLIVAGVVILGITLMQRGTPDEERLPISMFTLSSSAFTHKGSIPKKYTCDGEDISPPLAISNVPQGTKSIALIVDDPDAPAPPAGGWVHLVAWNIDAGTSLIEEEVLPEGVALGMNDFGRSEYGGPCPPSGTHRYFFKAYALDTTLTLPRGSSKAELEEAMEGHILARAELMGTYTR